MNVIPLCHHTMPNGNTCGSPAMRNQRFCYFHNEQQKRAVRSKRARHPQSSHACPFHPNVTIRRKKCPLFLATLDQNPSPIPCELVTCGDSPIRYSEASS